MISSYVVQPRLRLQPQRRSAEPLWRWLFRTFEYHQVDEHFRASRRCEEKVVGVPIIALDFDVRAHSDALANVGLARNARIRECCYGCLSEYDFGGCPTRRWKSRTKWAWSKYPKSLANCAPGRGRSLVIRLSASWIR